MKRLLIIGMGLLVGLAFLVAVSLARQQSPAGTPAPERQQQQSPAPATSPSQERVAALGALKTADRFDGKVSLRTRDNRSSEVQVAIRNWVIRDHERIEKFPEEGFLIVHLRAGELTTVINGNRQDRQEDEFWTVPANTTMSIETDRDTATIQTWTVKGP
jgi:hypothetical protein